MLTCVHAHTINNTMTSLDQWNALTAQEAAEAVLPCCGSKAWARGLVARRPLNTLPELLAASDTVWSSLSEPDCQEAFNSHPRIGQSHAQTSATEDSLRWSANEQSAAMQSADNVKQRLAEGNQAYEETFGRIFIVCATGKSSQEILSILERRMHNTPHAELLESAEQQRQITHLRLQKWLEATEQEHTR